MLTKRPPSVDSGLRDLIEAVRDRIGKGRGGIKEEVVAEIRQAKDKWLAEWMQPFTDDSTPTNGYRVVYDLMKVVDRDRTIAIHDAGGIRGYLAPFWIQSRPDRAITSEWAVWQPWDGLWELPSGQSLADRTISFSILSVTPCILVWYGTITSLQVDQGAADR